MKGSPVGELQNRTLFWRNLQACYSSAGCAHNFETGKRPEEEKPGWSRKAGRTLPSQAVAHSLQHVCTELNSRLGVTHLHNARLLLRKLSRSNEAEHRSRRGGMDLVVVEVLGNSPRITHNSTATSQAKYNRLKANSKLQAPCLKHEA